jgi:hypothetical protein
MRLRSALLLVAWAIFLTLLVMSMFGRLPTAEGPPRTSDVVVIDGEREVRHG